MGLLSEEGAVLAIYEEIMGFSTAEFPRCTLVVLPFAECLETFTACKRVHSAGI